MVYRNRLGDISREIEPRTQRMMGAMAQAVKLRAQRRVAVRTGALRDAIHVDRMPDGDYMVKAGNYEVWYGHFVEFGTSPHRIGDRTHPGTAARPFLIPAAEETRAEVPAFKRLAFRDL